MGPCSVMRCEREAVGEVNGQAVCASHGGKHIRTPVMADGPRLLAGASGAGLVIGLLLLPWIRVTGPGGEVTRGFFRVMEAADPGDGDSLLDQFVFSDNSRWYIGAAVAIVACILFMASAGRIDEQGMLGVDAACVSLAALLAYIASRLANEADAGNAFSLTKAHLGVGAYVTVVSALVAVAASWVVAHSD